MVLSLVAGRKVARLGFQDGDGILSMLQRLLVSATLALVAMLSQRGRAAEARPYVELFVASAPPALAGEVSRARRWLAEGPAPR